MKREARTVLVCCKDQVYLIVVFRGNHIELSEILKGEIKANRTKGLIEQAKRIIIDSNCYDEIVYVYKHKRAEKRDIDFPCNDFYNIVSKLKHF